MNKNSMDSFNISRYLCSWYDYRSNHECLLTLKIFPCSRLHFLDEKGTLVIELFSEFALNNFYLAFNYW